MTGGHTSRRWPKPSAFSVGLAVVVSAILVAGARQTFSGWHPAGDEGFWTLLTRSVMSWHPPLLNTWSSGSLAAGVELHHPGPLVFVFLAPFVALLGNSGMALGVSALHAVCLGGSAVVVRRTAGAAVGTVAVAVMGGVAWMLGSQVLAYPWNPFVGMTATLLTMCCAWGVASGDRGALPVGVAAASLAAQVHLGFVVFAPAVLGAGIVVAVFREVKLRRGGEFGGSGSGEGSKPGEGASFRWLAFSAAFGFVLWAPPILQQLRQGADGNLYRLATHTSFSVVPGGELGLRRLAASWARVVVDPFGRKTFHALVLRQVVGPGVWLALVAPVVVLGLLWLRLRRRVEWFGPLCLVLVAGGVVGAAQGRRVPLVYLGFPSNNLRFVWVMGVMVLVAVAAGLNEIVAPTESAAPGRRRLVSVPAVTVAVMFGLANLVPARTEAPVLAQYQRATERALDRLDGLLEETDPDARVVEVRLDTEPTTLHAAPGVLLWLDGHGYVGVSEHPSVLWQLGPRWGPAGGLAGGNGVDVVLTLSAGESTPVPIASDPLGEGGRGGGGGAASRSIRGSPLTRSEQKELAALRKASGDGSPLSSAQQLRLVQLAGLDDTGSVRVTAQRVGGR